MLGRFSSYPLPKQEGRTSQMLINTTKFRDEMRHPVGCKYVLLCLFQGSYKAALMRALWSLFVLLMLFLFKYLLCQKLNGDVALDYSEVMSPVFILLQLVMIRACNLH